MLLPSHPFLLRFKSIEAKQNMSSLSFVTFVWHTQVEQLPHSEQNQAVIVVGGFFFLLLLLWFLLLLLSLPLFLLLLLLAGSVVLVVVVAAAVVVAKTCLLIAVKTLKHKKISTTNC